MDILIVEADRRSIGFARFRKSGTAVIFQGAERRSAEDPDAFGRMLDELSAAADREESVILSLDPETLFSRELELPIADRRKQREVLPLELKGETALAVEDLVFDSLPLGVGKVLAIWGVRSEVEAKIKDMTGAGVEPRFVGSSIFHWNLLLPQDTDGAPLAVSDGRALAVYAGGSPVMFRSLSRGDFHREIVGTLAILEAGKGIRVERCLLHGSAASCDHGALDESGTVRFAPLPVSGALAQAFPGEGTALEYAGAWALAAASLRGEPVNFRHGNLAYNAGSEHLKRKFRLTAILAGLCLALLLGETGLRYYLAKSDLNSLDRSILQIYREVFPNRAKPVDAVSELKAEIRRLGGGVAGEGVLRPLALLAGAKGDGILGIYETDIEGDVVFIKGDARSFQAAGDFKSSLSPHFESLSMEEVKSLPDGRVSFALRGKLKEGPK